MLVPAPPSPTKQGTRTLWASGLPEEANEVFLYTIFAASGTLASARLSRKLQADSNQKIAFLEFVTPEAAQDALLAYNGKQLPGSGVTLQLSLAPAQDSDLLSEVSGGNPESHSLYVGDLSPDINDAQLQQHFKQFFTSVSSAKVICDRNSGRSKGYGFVRFDSEEQRDRAMRVMQGQKIGGQPIRVSQAKAKMYQGDGLFHPSDFDPSNTTAFVGNVNADVTEEDLRQVFARCGDISSVKVLRAKGCAFVTFSQRASAERAIVELHGKVIKNSAIRLCWGRRSTPQRRPVGNLIQDPRFARGMPAGINPNFAAGGLPGGLAALPHGALPGMQGLQAPNFAQQILPQHLLQPAGLPQPALQGNMYAQYPAEYPQGNLFYGHPVNEGGALREAGDPALIEAEQALARLYLNQQL